MICERCADEIDNGAARPPPEMRGPIWVIAGEKRSVEPMVRRIFGILWARRDVLVRREAFMTQLYGMRADPPFDKTVDVHIFKLRRALEGSVFRIDTRYAEGWRLVTTASPSQPRSRKPRTGRLIARGMAMAVPSQSPKRPFPDVDRGRARFGSVKS
jgi:DNA-binding winged helix-turn-helix (wHTH) protein